MHTINLSKGTESGQGRGRDHQQSADDPQAPRSRGREQGNRRQDPRPGDRGGRERQSSRRDRRRYRRRHPLHRRDHRQVPTYCRVGFFLHSRPSIHTANDLLIDTYPALQVAQSSPCLKNLGCVCLGLKFSNVQEPKRILLCLMTHPTLQPTRDRKSEFELHAKKEVLRQCSLYGRKPLR